MKIFNLKVQNGKPTFTSEHHKALWQDFMKKMEGKYINVQEAEDKSKRTPSQNNAIHLFCEKLARSLNDSGLYMNKILRVDIDWTKDSVKKYLWKPFQKKKFGTESTTQLKKLEQIDAIHADLMRELGEKRGVEYIAFPSICNDPKGHCGRKECIKCDAK